MGRSIAETDREATLLERFLALLPESLDSFDTCRQLVVEYGIAGAKVHDAQLAGFDAYSRIADDPDFQRFRLSEVRRYRRDSPHHVNV